jgi:hypothetical protein
MKKTFLFLVLCVAVMAGNAQKKLTKTDIVGTWNMSVMDVAGQLYYDVDKDSLFVGSEIMEQMPGMADADSATKASAIGMIKLQFAALKNTGITFNADGTYTSKGPGDAGTGTYTFDEATQTITRSVSKPDQPKTFTVNNGALKSEISKDGESVAFIFKKK